MLALLAPRLPPPVKAGSNIWSATCGSSVPVRAIAPWSSVVTGAEPTSAAVGMLEPVTMTRSDGAVSLDPLAVWACAPPQAASELPNTKADAQRASGLIF